MAAYYLIIEQGTTSQYAWPVTDDDNNSIALSGYTGKAQIRRSITDASVLHEWNLSPVASAGQSQMLLQGSSVILVTPPAISLAWSFTRGVYDILITAPDGTTSRVAEGVVEVSRSVTR
jgi:hypothetical protein